MEGLHPLKSRIRKAEVPIASPRGEFDTETWSSTGIDYTVEVESDASDKALADLLSLVDEIPEIPRAIRTGTIVKRR